MAFIRAKQIKGVNYYYLVENKRIDGKVKQNILEYYGTTRPGDVSTTKQKVSTTKQPEHVSTVLKRIAPDPGPVVSTTPGKVSTTPLDVQIILQRRAAKNNMTADEYLAKILEVESKHTYINKNGQVKKSNHKYDENGKKIY